MTEQRKSAPRDTVASVIIRSAEADDVTARFTRQFSWQCDDLMISILLPDWSQSYHDYARIIKKYVLYYHLRRFLTNAMNILSENGYSSEVIVDHGLIVETTIQVHDEIHTFWTNAHGWAPAQAAELLSKSRLDRLVSLAHTLSIWFIEAKREEHDGRLILAWANLGALLEGTLKFFLCVFLSDYRKNPIAKNRREGTIDPDQLTLNDLKGFYEKYVWIESQRKIWSPWLQNMIEVRNSIHAFRDRDIYSFEIFHKRTSEYLDLLIDLFDGVPWPSELDRGA